MYTLGSVIHEYGNIVVFSASLLEESGLPIPATPIYIAAGVAAGTGEMNLSIALGLAVVGSLLGDVLWFFLGRWRGQKILEFLCRVSLEPDSCVRDTEERFLRHGVRSLVFAKFLPGIGSVIRPLAAVAGVGLGEFMFYTCLGTILYNGTFMGVGYLFSDQSDQIMKVLDSTGHTLLWALVALVVLYLLYKLERRRQFLRNLATARLPVEELKQKMDAGQPVVIVDLRTPLQIKAFPFIIPGALLIPLQEMEQAYVKIPGDREVVLLCNCPNEVSSAKAALFLQKKGFANARPLVGGIDRWKEKAFPLESIAQLVEATLTE